MAESHDDFAGVAELYALGVLPDDERAAFERHLRSCAVCVDEVARFRETVAALPTPDVQLPPGAKDRVMAAVGAEAGGSTAGTGRPASTVVELAARRRRAQMWLAAACALVVGIGAAVVIWRAVDSSSTQPPVAQPPVVASVMAAPDMTKASGDVRGGTVAAMYAPSQRATVVATADLPRIPADMMYQVWITVGGEKKSAGMVPGGKSDKSMVVMTDMERPSTVGLSVEPAAGSSQPTSPMVVDLPVP